MEERIKEYITKFGLLLKQIEAGELEQNGDVVIGNKIDGVWNGPMVTYFLRGDNGDYEMILEVRGMDEGLMKMLAVVGDEYLGVLMVNKVVGLEENVNVRTAKTYYVIGGNKIDKRVMVSSGEELSCMLVNSFGNTRVYECEFGEKDLEMIGRTFLQNKFL